MVDQAAIPAAGVAAELATAARGAHPGAPVTVEFATRARLEDLEAEWRDLVANSVEQNPFYAPWMLLPALDHLGGGDIEVACVFEARGADRLLIGLAPLSIKNSYARFPITIVKLWTHEHCFFGAPLVRRGHEAQFFRALYSRIEAHPVRPALLRFSHLRTKGALFAAAQSAASNQSRFFWRTNEYERAELRGPVVAADFLAQTVRKKKRKEFNRLRNRLSEIGDIAFFQLERKEDIDHWVRLFLSIENGGWKAEAASALASSRESTAFFKDAIAGAFEAGTLRFYRLDVGGRTISMIVNFISRGEGYSFKICHDGEFSRFSPGVLLELELLRAIEHEKELVFFDSCAAPDHPMINSLWRERVRIGGLNIGRKGAGSSVILRTIKGLEDISSQYRALRRNHTRSRS